MKQFAILLFLLFANHVFSQNIDNSLFDRVEIFGQPSSGIILNGNNFKINQDGTVDLTKCAIPFPHRPISLHGVYRLIDNSPSTSNNPTAFLLLKKFNPATGQSDTIGYGTMNRQLLSGSDWQKFEFPIKYTSSDVPDSIVVAFFAPLIHSQPSFIFDNLEFRYSTTSVMDFSSDSGIGYYIDGNLLHIELAKNVTNIKIFENLGRKVLTSRSSVAIDLSLLKNSLYILQVELDNESRSTYKISR